jgi:aspartate beta-hydroxylase
MNTETERLLAAASDGPLPEAGFRVASMLRELRGAGEGDIERLRRWSGLLSRRLRGEESLAPADPQQRPTILYLDGFPDHAWHDTADHPVTAVLEESSEMIRAELFGQTRPAEDWAEYSQSVVEDRKWRATWFYRHGRRDSQTAALFPRTSALLDAHSGPSGPLASTLGDCFLSRLEAGGRIPAHTGLCNISLVGHLALAIPAGCGIRVGATSRGWEEGRCLVFDDTFEHETWNTSGSDRYVLVFVLWRHGVTPIEREYMRVMTRWLNDLSVRGAAGPA